ncbi:MAG: type I glyceraldehyde-3-phosphate dehydrogenase [Clostridiales bacterium]|jgi:glyceraldehyde 3-phosphate dehydrogenase|nr:type I glyceraldehyde-3-phosphate dehydrogenase [Clostridiales bacterium]
MTVRVAINGFGRIGRLVFRALWEKPEVVVVAINDLADAATNAHLLRYDSTHGIWHKDVGAGDDYISVEGKKINTYGEMNPVNLPWNELEIDVVVEASGKFNDALKAKAHLEAGAKKVILTAPGKNEDVTLVMGVNENIYQKEQHHIISNASCTTNCLAPVAKVLQDNFGIKKGLMTTIHAYTNDQKILDQFHKDLRRARSAGASIIPTSTGAAKAVALVLPELKGKIHGFAMRVPTANVSVVDFTAELERNVTVDDINGALAAAAAGPLKGILQYSDLPLVSIDFNGNSHSSIVDALSTMVIGDNLVKVVAWYDNEWGYSCRIADLLLYISDEGR